MLIGQNRKRLRYIRWASKLVFLILFIVPIAYVPSSLIWQTPTANLTTFSTPGYKPFISVTMAWSPCSIWLNGWSNPDPAGAWLVEPLGALQALITSKVAFHLLYPTIIALGIVLAFVVLLGSAFCSWACPLGSIIDSFDIAIGKCFHKIEAKRVLAYQNSKLKANKPTSCSLCPATRLITRNNVASTGIVVATVAGSAVAGFNIFCLICPIGIATRGLFHLKATTYLSKITNPAAQVINPFFVEFLIFPIVAVLVSLKERRFWCNKLCPVGALLNGVATVNPLVKFSIDQQKCVMNGCPDDCKDSHLGYCTACRIADDRKCEKVCPAQINITGNGSMHRCTKCMECYIACDHGAIKFSLVGKPDVFRLPGYIRDWKARRKNKSNQKTGQ
jgi:ferredoxin-type protein NapH